MTDGNPKRGTDIDRRHTLARLRVDQVLASHRPGDKPLAVITDMDDATCVAE